MQTNGLMVFGCRGHPALAQGICHEIGCEPGAIEIFEYGNDNTFVRVLENVREADVFVVQTSRRPVTASAELLAVAPRRSEGIGGRTAVTAWRSVTISTG